MEKVKRTMCLSESEYQAIQDGKKRTDVRKIVQYVKKNGIIRNYQKYGKLDWFALECLIRFYKYKDKVGEDSDLLYFVY